MAREYDQEKAIIGSGNHGKAAAEQCFSHIVDGMLQFINEIRKTDRYIEIIYMNGACYQFYLLLNKFFPGSKPYISKAKDHVITKYNGNYYDITGEVSGNWYTPMTEIEIDMASRWSFHRIKVIQIGECPHCGEPIVT
jgi:hypothetical protein